MSKNIGIISAGAWGTAVAKVVAENGHNVQMWDFMDDVVNDINNKNENSKFLFGVNLPKNITASNNFEEVAANKDMLIIATPSLYIMNIVRQLVKIPDVLEGKVDISVLAKGFIKTDSGPKLILSAMEDYLPGIYKDNLVYISGPSHAEEVARGKLTGLISASKNPKKSIRFRELLSGKTLLVYSSLDTAGVQTCGAVKNVIAIAFGMLDAFMDLSQNFGDNTESLLLAAGLNEIQSLGVALGSSHPQTFTSIAGVGDLDVTCRSKFGRNRRFGREIIKSKILDRFNDLDDLIKNIDAIGFLPEGVVAAEFVHKIAQDKSLKLPISEYVYRILNKEVEPYQALKLMAKGLRTQTE